MALENAQQRRADGVRGLTADEMAGTRGADGRGVILPTVGFENPGPTANMRGVEPNTGKSEGSNIGDPMISIMDGLTYDPPVQFPDSSGVTACSTGDPAWAGTDSAAKNSYPAPHPTDSFDTFGEHYQGNGTPDEY